MIDEKKIQEASDNYVGHDAFKDGVAWFKKNLWHDIQEEPEKDEVLVTCFVDEGECYEIDSAAWVDNWREHCRRESIIKWCYLSDIWA